MGIPDSIQVTVDKATFLEVGRIFQRVYRPRGAKNVILTLGNGRLRIEFFDGGSDLPCEHTHNILAEMSAKSFAGIVAAYRQEKSPSGTIVLTFRPELGEFATPLAGRRAAFKSVSCSS